MEQGRVDSQPVKHMWSICLFVCSSGFGRVSEFSPQNRNAVVGLALREINKVVVCFIYHIFHVFFLVYQFQWLVVGRGETIYFLNPIQNLYRYYSFR